ncbi:glycoside hydrolase family 10 protein [Hamadaea tsunoensis]|uniref:glycoside hydrolase family 10 protein n=1 Tax=Hamadaea tsunoensis TaxID=53368 RepID=UPI00041D0522|nr:family 10 glycosylhydrolase [Hamadaea tsunoensis]
MRTQPRLRPVRRIRIALRSAAVVLVIVAGLAAWLAGPAASPLTGDRSAADVGPCLRAPAPRELRGLWITTVRNSDWPSKPGLPEETVKAEFIGWLDLAVRLNFNAVYVHVRPSGDAFWPSAYAPWSYWLTGRKDGADPGWDPMAFMVGEAHKRNLEFHAWFNPYKASQDATAAQLPPGDPALAHPEWLVTYPPTGGDRRLYFDPGIPAARTFVEDSILEAVGKYDIDGVHFDDFFYPYPGNGGGFPDSASFAAYGNGMGRDDWRRHNVDLLVQEMSTRIKALKPWVKFGISPFGIWRNNTSDPAGSATKGLEAYSAIYADTRHWVQAGWLDYIAPQLYWNIGYSVANFTVLLKWWEDVVKGTRTDLYIGLADYRVGQSGAWKDPAQLDRQLTLIEAPGGAAGAIHFTASDLRANRLGSVTRYVRAHYPTPALVPLMGQLQHQRLSYPPVRAAGDTGSVTWSPPHGSDQPASYAVYRAVKPNDPATLVAVVRATGGRQTWTDPAAGRADHYCVTALDRLGNETS